MRQRWSKQKTKKTKYNFKYYYLGKVYQHIGETDNLCRTTKSHWMIYNNYNYKEIYFDLNSKSKHYNFNYNLELIQKNNNTTYKYKEESITRQQFVILLGCDM